jgi:hypothetical protein
LGEILAQKLPRSLGIGADMGAQSIPQARMGKSGGGSSAALRINLP